MKSTMTTGDAAKHFGVALWQVRRVYERGMLPQPARCGLYRVISDADLPKLENALRMAGYLREEVAHVG